MRSRAPRLIVLHEQGMLSIHRLAIGAAWHIGIEHPAPGRGAPFGMVLPRATPCSRGLPDRQLCETGLQLGMCCRETSRQQCARVEEGFLVETRLCGQSRRNGGAPHCIYLFWSNLDLMGSRWTTMRNNACEPAAVCVDCELESVVNTELRKDRGEMMSHCCLADTEPIGDRHIP